MRMSYFFRFESEQERSLSYIPMLVRMKLDTCGVKLSLGQWNRLPEAERRRLFELPCDDCDQARSYRELLSGLVSLYTGEVIRLLQPIEVPAWLDLRSVPAQVAGRAAELGFRQPSLEQWRSLSAPQRYALLKLTREGHESANYVPALREFALI
jgi:hypothetical protein